MTWMQLLSMCSESEAEDGPIVTFHLGLIYFLGARNLSWPKPDYVTSLDGGKSGLLIDVSNMYGPPLVAEILPF